MNNKVTTKNSSYSIPETTKKKLLNEIHPVIQGQTKLRFINQNINHFKLSGRNEEIFGEQFDIKIMFVKNNLSLPLHSELFLDKLSVNSELYLYQLTEGIIFPFVKDDCM